MDVLSIILQIRFFFGFGESVLNIRLGRLERDQRVGLGGMTIETICIFFEQKETVENIKLDELVE